MHWKFPPDPGYHDRDPDYCERVLAMLDTEDPALVALVIGFLKPSEVASGTVDLVSRIEESATEIVLRRRGDVERLMRRAGTPHLRRIEIFETAAVGVSPWPAVVIDAKTKRLGEFFPSIQVR